MNEVNSLKQIETIEELEELPPYSVIQDNQNVWRLERSPSGELMWYSTTGSDMESDEFSPYLPVTLLYNPEDEL